MDLVVLRSCLEEVARGLAQLTVDRAHRFLVTPTVDGLGARGRELFELSLLTAECITRLSELGVVVDPRSHFRAGPVSKESPGESADFGNSGETDGVLPLIESILKEADPLLYGPCIRTTQKLQERLRGEDLPDAQASLSLTRIQRPFERASPAMPVRPPEISSGRLGSAKVVEDLAGQDQRAKLFHLNAVEVELATVEVCARLIVDFPEMQWAFVEDMARQLWDETRHFEAFRGLLEREGGRLGDYSSSHSLWEMSRGCDPALCLAMHQCIGEWHGVDGAFYHVELFREQGQPRAAEVFEVVARDEITHVAIGNRWIQRLVRPESLPELWDQAEAVRVAHGKRSEEDLPTFPFNEWACREALFPPGRIQTLMDRAARHGKRGGKSHQNS